MRYLEVDTGSALALPPMAGRPALCHVFAEVDVRAVNAALAAERPLLLRGEPGVGKSQLARAAAHGLGRAFVTKVVAARTEPSDLLFRFDAVKRLAAAQVAGLVADQAALDRLEEQRFVSPGPLWWAFD